MRQPVSKNLLQMQREANKKHRTGETEPGHEGWRPKVRGDCIDGPRPCPFVGCKYHLFLDVAEKGSIKFNFDEDVSALLEMKNTCALDVAERGGVHLQEVGNHINITRERARQLEERCLNKLHRAGAMDFYTDEDEIIDGD